jgi:hypothetical protein
MKRITLPLALLLIASPLLAADPPAGISVSIPVLIVPALPTSAEAMHPDEFHVWAIDQNQKALDAANKYNAAMRQANGDNEVRKVTITEKSESVTHRFGGGVGYGGFGGSGGYCGYLSATDNVIMGQGGSAGLTVLNYGFGFNRPGNSTQTTNDSTSKTYELIYRSNAYYGPGVTIVNPFCPPKRDK